VNINTAVFCDVTPCNLAEETAHIHVLEYNSLNCVIPLPEDVHWRRFSLVKFMLCFRNNSNYSGNCLNYLLRIILLFVCYSKKQKYLAEYSDYTARQTKEKSCLFPVKVTMFLFPKVPPSPLPTG
jgi:hypothetical protein